MSGKIKPLAFPLYGGRQGAGLFRKAADKKDLLVHCAQNSHIWIQTFCNDARLCKVTSIRTWKRTPDRVEVRLKYGLYEYSNFSLIEALDRVLIPVRKIK
jgi:hypothetical protein